LWVPFFLSFLLAFLLAFVLYLFSSFFCVSMECLRSWGDGVMVDVPFSLRSNSSVQTWVCRGLMGSLLLLLCTRSGSFFFLFLGGFCTQE
jgi:hypothetical protein